MGNRQNPATASIDRQFNVMMYGLNRSGKTQMMYTGLVGNDTIDTYKNLDKNFSGIEAS